MEHKRGDTLTFIVKLVDEENEALVIPTTSMRSEMRDISNKKIDDFTIETTAVDGEYLFTANGDTNKYPLETLYIDIEFDEDGNIKSSETFTINIVKDITLPKEV